jgi:hypothetical protein
MSYKCDRCKNKAVHNLQSQYVLYRIDKKDNFKEEDSWVGDTNEFYCEDCYNKEF